MKLTDINISSDIINSVNSYPETGFYKVINNHQIGEVFFCNKDESMVVFLGTNIEYLFNQEAKETPKAGIPEDFVLKLIEKIKT